MIADFLFSIKYFTHTVLQGFYVLAGVDSEKRAKTQFIFDSVKGLEPIVLDPADPAHVQRLVYRVDQLQGETGRPLVGIVHNAVRAGESIWPRLCLYSPGGKINNVFLLPLEQSMRFRLRM